MDTPLILSYVKAILNGDADDENRENQLIGPTSFC